MAITEWLLVSIGVILIGSAAGHALLYKRDPKAAWGWIAVCVIFPIFGPLLYFFFGINRVKIRARQLEENLSVPRRHVPTLPIGVALCSPEDLSVQYRDIARISDAVTLRPIVGGNSVEILHNGESAYPAMLKAIEEAERSVFLCTYIFETNQTGMHFIEALSRALERGVTVKVLLDGFGEFYYSPRASTVLRRFGIDTARFIPPSLIPPTLNVNLRNHRKILSVDSHIAFVGGMNIGDRHLASVPHNPRRVVDAHFRLCGPVVQQIEQVFRDDWYFCTGEKVDAGCLVSMPGGSALCRAIADGPTEEHDKIAIILAGAVSAARQRILIMTPYFLPSRELIGALQSASLRGVHVVVVLPEKNNLLFVKWATSNMLWELLLRGVRIYYQPPPFVHTKLFIVDDYYAQVGSANIDSRSLRLNFELAVEVFDKPFIEELAQHVYERIQDSCEITLDQVDSRPFLIRIRDALAWLFYPYL
ncbi:MAG TPA: phospholipase D-like domain-containing protein [Thermodesulfobacteriota bacterium]|nr:PLDc N-terminal domain-containing protein [Deltaproteobacteria bacterium]HNR13764.1 phospholipase D-like domain-containing protein [Thermodesulfobacteriota bacterium]HNU70962.1 phospholipase D-like domain-containing protein [Thermodesulfobacteriota bacterium]